MNIIETEELGSVRIETYYDEDPMNPRDWDNLATFDIYHRKYKLADEAGDLHFRNFDTFEEWKEEIDAVVIIPLYLYDHSGITIQAGAANDWDSTDVGYAYITNETATQAFGPATQQTSLWNKYKSIEEWAEAVIRSEIDTYASYLEGQVFGYVVIDNDTEEVLDSCWGFFDHDDMLEEARIVAKSAALERSVKHAQATAIAS